MQLHFGKYSILITYENSYGEVANQETDDAVLLKTIHLNRSRNFGVLHVCILLLYYCY